VLITDGRRDPAAVAMSLALHACFLALLALALRHTVDTGSPEMPAVAQLLRIEHRPPSEHPAEHAAAAASAVAPAHAAIPHVVPRPNLATVREAAAPAPNVTYRPTVSGAQTARIALPGGATAPVSTSAQAPAPLVSTTPLASASPAPVAAASTAPIGGGGNPGASGKAGLGNFGESYDPTLDPDVRKTVVAGVGAGFVVQIEVDENGHATKITFVSGPADAAEREALRAKLLAASYVTAICNGLPCAGTFELKT
jgi:hypothetical protein